MFTGLIEQVGELAQFDSRGDAAHLVIRCAPWPDPLKIGESIAVHGVCLTVTAVDGTGFECDVLQATLQRTNLAVLPRGAALNLERALRLGDRLGGHMVTGHVDGTGQLVQRRMDGPDWTLVIACAAGLRSGLVPQGSIACDGVSLTVAELHADRFAVHVIPHSWAHTALRALRIGDAVNLELDLLGKYARQASGGGVHSTVSLDLLARTGFLSSLT